MIIRIMGEGQWKASDALLAKLNALDEKLESCFGSGDETSFEAVRDEMLALVRGEGSPLPAEELAPSDVILPSSDATIDEVQVMLGREGLVPG